LDQTSFQRLLDEVRGLKEHPDAKLLDASKLERIVSRLNAFSRAETCESCKSLLEEAEERIGKLAVHRNALPKDEHKAYRKWVGTLTTHLQQRHKLVPEGFYLAIYMSIGLSIGLSFGLTIFENIALGLPIGMSIGVAIGAGLDADAKKKGKTI
jgi:hypothetical protein